MKRWLESEYPAIREEAKKAGARIFFTDEAAAKSDYHSGTSWAPRGADAGGGEDRAAFLNQPDFGDQSRRGASLDGGGRNDERGAVRGVPRGDGEGRRKPIYLIVDGHPAHRAKVVTRWLEKKNKERLRMFMLPGYSPHLPPCRASPSRRRGGIRSAGRPRRAGIDFRRGRRLGKRDHVIVIERPRQRPAWMSAERYASMPERLKLRETPVREGNKPKTLVSTMLDGKKVPASALKNLYKKRWGVELEPPCVRIVDRCLRADSYNGRGRSERLS